MFGNGKGLFGGNPMAMRPEPQKAPQQGGFGGFLQRSQMPLAQIADTLLRYSGSGGSPVLARLQQQQDLQQIQGYRTQQAKQQQDAEQQQWIARQAWERANPEPIRRENNMGDFIEIDPNSGATRTIYRDPYAPTVVGPDGIRRPLDFMPRPSENAPETLSPAQVAAMRQGGGQPPSQGGPQAMNAQPGARQSITVDNASRIRASMPAGRAGDEQFANWLRANNVQIGAF